MLEALKERLSKYSLRNYDTWKARIIFENKDEDLQIVEFKNPESSCEYIRAVFHGYKLSIYGDYGFWGFDLTWKGNVFNMPYDNPGYWYGKLAYEFRESGNPYDDSQCREDILEAVKDLFEQGEVTEEKQKTILEFLKDHSYVIPEELEEYEEFIEQITEMLEHTDEYEWISYLRDNTEELEPYFGEACEWSLWNFGKKVHVRIWIAMYLLGLAREQLLTERDDRNE
jgi:hypothetical protein